MDIVLGTVQFGLDYGVSNTSGKITEEGVSDILSTAWNNGISTLDTAKDYGNSEELIGNLSGNYKWNIITKIPAISAKYIDKESLIFVQKSLEKSMNYLQENCLEAVFVHSCDDLFKPGGENLFKYLEKLKNSGRINKIGVSVYDGQQIDLILDRFEVDIIQLPLSILDQRLIRSGHLEKIKKNGIELHARSIFLQGLLLMPLSRVPKYFSNIYNNLRNFKLLAHKASMSDLEFAVNFIKNIEYVDKIVIGVDTAEQLLEIIKALKIRFRSENFSDIAVYDERYVNPAKWNL